MSQLSYRLKVGAALVATVGAMTLAAGGCELIASVDRSLIPGTGGSSATGGGGKGTGGGGMAPTEQSIFADTFLPEKRAQAFALYGLTVVTAPAVGPTLSGWMVEHWSWRWLFWVKLLTLQPNAMQL